MAEIKEKKKIGAFSVFAKEYKFEGIILLVLALIAIVLGALVISGENGNEFGLNIQEDVFLIGDYPKAFAWVLIVLGVTSLVLAVFPYYKPSYSELKKVTWPTKGNLLKNTATVFIFIVIMALFFFVCDIALDKGVIKFFEWLGGIVRL